MGLGWLDVLPYDVWELIRTNCTPFTEYRLSLTCRQLIQHQKSMQSPCHYEWESNTAGIGSPDGHIQAQGFEVIKILPYDFLLYGCQISDPVLEKRLVLIDEYWSDRARKEGVVYRSFQRGRHDGRLMFRATLPREQYTPRTSRYIGLCGACQLEQDTCYEFVVLEVYTVYTRANLLHVKLILRDCRPQSP